MLPKDDRQRLDELEAKVSFLQVAGGITGGACLWLAYGLWLALGGLPDRHGQAGDVDRNPDPELPVPQPMQPQRIEQSEQQLGRPVLDLSKAVLPQVFRIPEASSEPSHRLASP